MLYDKENNFKILGVKSRVIQSNAVVDGGGDDILSASTINA